MLHYYQTTTVHYFIKYFKQKIFSIYSIDYFDAESFEYINETNENDLLVFGNTGLQGGLCFVGCVGFLT